MCYAHACIGAEAKKKVKKTVKAVGQMRSVLGAFGRSLARRHRIAWQADGTRGSDTVDRECDGASQWRCDGGGGSQRRWGRF